MSRLEYRQQVSPRSQPIHTQTVGLRASDLNTIMHGVADAGSVRASQWLRREHAACMATPLLALHAWLSRNIKKRTRNVSSWSDERVSLRGLGFIRSKYV